MSSSLDNPQTLKTASVPQNMCSKRGKLGMESGRQETSRKYGGRRVVAQQQPVWGERQQLDQSTHWGFFCPA